MRKVWNKITLLGACFLVNRAVNMSINALTIILIERYGLSRGVELILLISFLAYLALIFFYDWYFSTRTIEEKNENYLTKKINKLPHYFSWLIFLIVILWDPSLAVFYYREKSNLHRGIPSLKIFGIFMLSLFASTAVWIGETYGLYIVFKNLFC